VKVIYGRKKKIKAVLLNPPTAAPSWMYEIHLNGDDIESKSTEGNKGTLTIGNNSIVR